VSRDKVKSIWNRLRKIRAREGLKQPEENHPGLTLSSPSQAELENSWRESRERKQGIPARRKQHQREETREIAGNQRRRGIRVLDLNSRARENNLSL